ncbi:MAG: hypothetical protein NWE98_01860 [Candidatus Bathyarchaeota archaeon]|nr:hypothetical protein [Candidatus Bathyarchaeota archaeon]
MPLIFKSEPPEVKEVIKSRVNEMTAKKAFRTPVLAKAMLEKAPITPTPAQAFPVYNVGLKDLAEKGDLSTADQKSWRYLIKQEEKVVASADAIVGPDRKAVFSHINEGPLVNGVASAIQVANADEQVMRGQFEVRLLNIPALYFAALWLVDETKKNDLIIPLEPAPAPFVANKVITLKELLATLQRQAKATLTAQQNETLGG